MDLCALVEVVYYAQCGLPGGSRGEMTEFPTMVRVLEGYEVFVPLQLKRIDWKHEMFEEGEQSERECERARKAQIGQRRGGRVRARRRMSGSLW